MPHASIVRIISAGILAISLASAYAETVNSPSDLATNKRTFEYMNSHAMQNAMFRMGIEQDRKFGVQQECKKQYGIEPYSVSILQPIDFPDTKRHPVRGIWNIRYQFQRCDESKLYNAIFVASGDGDVPPTPRTYYPGATNASPVLVNDAMLGARTMAAMRSGLRDCKDIDVFDMRVTEPPHDVIEGEKTFRGVWKETWTFRLCGQMADVGISFIPHTNNDGGARYVIDPVRPGEGVKKQ